MEFKSITLDGFLSYYEETAFLFSDCTTIIIGKNNTGKSKLFDAFHFVLHGRVFDSQMDVWVEDEDSVAKMILNNKKKKDAIAKKGRTSSRVCLEMESEDIPEDVIFIERIYEYDFSKGENPCVKNSVSICYQDKTTGETDSYSDTSAEAKISSLFPLCLRDFVLFQGEAASDLMKLSKKNQSTIEKAIRQVARLDLFEKATEIANSYSKSKINSLTRITSSNKDLMGKKQQLENEIDGYNQKIQDKRKDIGKWSDDYDKLQATIIKEKEELEKEEEFLKLFKEKEKLILEQQKLADQLKNFRDINRPISDTWVFFKILDKIQAFPDFYEQLELKGQVPPTISQAEIKKSLRLHSCSLCGSDLPEGSKFFANVKRKEQNDAIDGLGRMMSGLNYTFNNKLYDIENVPDSIKEYVSNRRKQEDAKRFIQEKLDSVNNSIKNASVSSADEKRKQDIEAKKKLFLTTEKACKELQNDIFRGKERIEAWQDEIDLRTRRILTIVEQTGQVSILDKVKAYYAKRISKCMNSLCTAAQELAYNEIQSSANELYHDMVKENPAIVGDIRIDKQNSEIYTVNSYGEKITNLNTGSRIAIQLAVISGILSVAANQFNSFFPFVTDAPTSQLDAVNKMQTIKCMIRAFEQSIIIVKDDATTDSFEDPLHQLIVSSDMIGAAYELRLHRDEDATIDDQYTEISVVKGVDD